MRKISFAGRKIPIPANPLVRLLLGVLLLLGGLFSFLPVLGIWMLPLGLILLSVDVPMARRAKRRLDVFFGRLLQKRAPQWAKRLGYGSRSNTDLRVQSPR